MGTNPMGRYRDLVAALVLHGNVAIRSQSQKLDVGDGLSLRNQQWEILEYIVDHRDKYFSMIDISYQLSIPQSTFSKTVQLLCSYGLVEKYQTVNNRKNIILKPTAYGLEVYDRVTREHVCKDLQGFFDALEDVSDRDLERFVRALKILDDALLPDREEEELVLLRREQ